MSRISAVVVHWRDPAATLACLASLAREPEIDVLVVDNGSRHPLAVPPGVRYVRSEENRGYAGGANLGIRDALARRAEVVLLLNDDVRVHPGAACSALRVLDRDPRVAAVGAKVLAREDPQRLWLAWGRVTYRQSLVALCGAGELDGPAYAEERDVEWIAGCAMWLRARALAAVGLFDEEFFAYHEEVEWCARARAAGWRVVYCPDAVVTHGAKDAVVKPSVVGQHKVSIQHAEIQMVENAGHAVFWDDAANFNQRQRAFAQSLAKAHAAQGKAS